MTVLHSWSFLPDQEPKDSKSHTVVQPGFTRAVSASGAGYTLCPRDVPQEHSQHLCWKPSIRRKNTNRHHYTHNHLEGWGLSSCHLLEKKQGFLSFKKKCQKDCLFHQYLWTFLWFHWFHNYSFLVLAHWVRIPLKQMWRKNEAGKTDLKGFYALEFNTTVIVTPSFLSTESFS